jgi:hypothetical protein
MSINDWSITKSFQQVFDIKTEIGRMVDAATSETLLGPDRAQNFRICETVNGNPKDGAVDVVRALRKRLHLKNPKVQLLSLTLTDQLVRSCGLEVHQQIASKDFMSDMQSLVSGMNAEVDMEVNRKALLIIQCWGESFKDCRDELPLYYEMYASLRSQGRQSHYSVDLDSCFRAPTRRESNFYHLISNCCILSSGIRFPDYDSHSTFTPILVRPASTRLPVSPLIADTPTPVSLLSSF